MPNRTWTGACLACALAALATPTAFAADDPTARGFDPDPVRPAFSIDGAFAVETAGPAPAGARAGAFLLDYGRGLLALRLGGEREPLLAERLSAHLAGTFVLGPVEVGAELPLALYQRADFGLLTRQGVSGPLVAPVSTTALGDLRLGGKLPILRETELPLGLAALLELRLPTGDRDAFTGDGPMAIPGLVATRHVGRALRVDGQLGYAFRGAGQYAQLVVHDGLVYGLGLTYALPPLGRLRAWRAIGEATAGWPRGNDGSTDRYRAPASARLGLRADLGARFQAELGAGTGLGAAGYGRESWRVFGGIRWTDRNPTARAADEAPPPEPKPRDRDGDGVLDPRDRCPDDPGAAELDGCPDRDHDEIPDVQDKCPDQPGPAQNDGCPVERETIVEIETEKLSLKDAIHFDTAKDTIKPESNPMLDSIATLIKAHPELKRIRVEGHTDNVGSAAYNRDLSRRRAASVVRALVARGVAADRLTAEGYGFDRPIASNETALGRAKNRRVEFTILSEE